MEPAVVTPKLLKWMFVRWQYIAHALRKRIILYLQSFFSLFFCFFILWQPHNNFFSLFFFLSVRSSAKIDVGYAALLYNLPVLSFNIFSPFNVVILNY